MVNRHRQLSVSIVSEKTQNYPEVKVYNSSQDSHWVTLTFDLAFRSAIHSAKLSKVRTYTKVQLNFGLRLSLS